MTDQTPLTLEAVDALAGLRLGSPELWQQLRITVEALGAARAEISDLLPIADAQQLMLTQAQREGARLREALEAMRRYVHGDETLRSAEEKMEAALATDAGQEWTRSFARKVLLVAITHLGVSRIDEASLTKVVEEVCK